MAGGRPASVGAWAQAAMEKRAPAAARVSCLRKVCLRWVAVPALDAPLVSPLCRAQADLHARVWAGMPDTLGYSQPAGWQVRGMRAALDAADWVGGRETVGPQGAQVKQNWDDHRGGAAWLIRFCPAPVRACARSGRRRCGR
ncbi:hypothetical protein GCM10023165_03680 [Variovorax defluvii]|uniref:Uncharacterized protein n=1 Tax=Variovorax defluvii TaxID=913761 RepID=A0ABP8GV51_9BURK